MLAGMGMLLHGPAAAQLVIGPTVIEFGPKQKVAVVTVTLDRKAITPMRLQAEILNWRQTVKGENSYEATNDLLVTPPITELQPGQKQIFRLALRGPRPTQQELAYRFLLEDVSPALVAVQVSPDTTIDFRMRYDMPVLLAPTSPVVTQLKWKPCASDSSSKNQSTDACIHLLNAGNRRVKVKSLTLEGDNWQQTRAFGDGENILAGAQRQWLIPLDAGQSNSFRILQAQTARGETLQIERGEF